MATKSITARAIALEVEARTGIKPNLAENVIACLAEIAADELASGREFKIPGVVKLRLSYQPRKGKREVRNPQTGEMMMAEPKPANIGVRASVMPKMRLNGPSPTSKVGKEIAAEYKAKRGL